MRKGIVKKGKSLIVAALWILAIRVLFYFLSDGNTQQSTKDFRAEDIPRTENYEWNSYSDTLISHHRIWKSFDRSEYKMRYDIVPNSLKRSTINKRNTKRHISYDNYWGSVYQHIITHDQQYLNTLIQKIDSIQTKQKLGQLAFADMLVSFVQDIPYVLILSESCNEISDPEMRDNVARGMPCSGNNLYGLKTPLEFLASLEGDCDTRSVLLFALLKHYGYDVAIMVSAEYRHAILGVNMRGYGKAKRFRGKNYMAWETTAYGYKLGELSPTVNNMNFWHIVLVS